MGLNYNGAKFLLLAEARGVRFGHLLTIGRQSLTLTASDIRRLLKLSISPEIRLNLRRLALGSNEYAEQFLRLCGAEMVDSMDNADYEGATVLHDLNLPVPESLWGKYDVVLDGGSLEHVFNVPVALRNCMQMLKVGGHYVGMSPTNNYSGHGFYQFSPELFFAAFTPDNGFSMVDACIYEEDGRSAWYRLSQAADPIRRLTFQNCVPAHLLVLARKTAVTAIFEKAPQQRMYETAWSHADEAGDMIDKRLKRAAWRCLSHLPPRMFWFVLNTWNVRNRFREDMFKRVE